VEADQTAFFLSKSEYIRGITTILKIAVESSLKTTYFRKNIFFWKVKLNLKVVFVLNLLENVDTKLIFDYMSKCVGSEAISLIKNIRVV
jgi:hypothetical protein